MNWKILPPSGYITVGTCGHCGGPIITKMVTVITETQPLPPVEYCLWCNRRAKNPIEPVYGPIRDMV